MGGDGQPARGEPQLTRILWIGIGAALGANARYFISLWAVQKLGASFPWGTLLVNASGSLLLGFLVASSSAALPPSLRLLLTVGFLGSYTTFSTYAVESVGLWQSGRAWTSLANIFASNGLALLCAGLGIWLARRLQ